MSYNIKIFLLCPIPDGQKPITDYIIFKENFLTNFINLTQKNHKKIFLFFYFFLFFLFFTIFKSTFFSWNLNKFLIFTFFLTNLFVFLLYFINFIKWKILNNRFNESRLIYEEGSWYDSQIWEKPFLLIKNDKLIQSQKIMPIIQQFFRKFLILGYINIFFLMILYIL
jgi:hypothetical protein